MSVPATPKRPGATRRRPAAPISEALIAELANRLARNLPVRRTLNGEGRLHIDRQLPFLCVYRQPGDHPDAGTAKLVKGEASYLVASGASELHDQASALIHGVVKALSPQFGAFLVVEVWATPDGGRANDPAVPGVAPTFQVHPPPDGSAVTVVEILAQRLAKIRVLKQTARVEIVRDARAHPPGLQPLLSDSEAATLQCSMIGIGVPPVYRKPHSLEEFPLLMGSLRRSFALALRQGFFEFARTRTRHRPAHYHALGRRAVVKKVWDIDKQLANISSRFDYLLQLTPVNPTSAFEKFKQRRFERKPAFHYRPRTVDPGLLKRELYAIPIERVEDPALQRLFLEKQEELDLKITMIRDRETPRFLHESLQLFGPVEDDLVELAKALLAQVPAPSTTDGGLPPPVDAPTFAALAEAQFADYRQLYPGFEATVSVTDDVAGVMVSRGQLLINSQVTVSAARTEALLAHEVGTHLVTYFNGRAQPFKQLYAGLAGYEELQEGLAVLAEYLVGGLNAFRVRQLAARVMAAKYLTDGASFVETFGRLSGGYGFSPKAAFTLTMRIYRGGGLTKDMIYLRGLQTVLRYLGSGGDLAPLFIGKISAEHIPITRELLHRSVLRPAALLPRHLRDEAAKTRLERLRAPGVSVATLFTPKNDERAARLGS